MQIGCSHVHVVHITAPSANTTSLAHINSDWIDVLKLLLLLAMRKRKCLVTHPIRTMRGESGRQETQQGNGTQREVSLTCKVSVKMLGSDVFEAICLSQQSPLPQFFLIFFKKHPTTLLHKDNWGNWNAL